MAIEPKPPHRPRVFVLLLIDGFSMLSFAAATEPLRSLNRLIGHDAFEMRLARVEEGPVHASNGLPFAALPLPEALVGAEMLFVCGGLRIKPRNERLYLAALRRAAHGGIGMGALSTGAYLLARAGLLAGYRCTIHWENRIGFQEEFPELHCTDKIYEIDRNRLTCSGGTASMDLMLRLIADRYGDDLARRVANQFHHDRIRTEQEEQRGGRADRRTSLPPLLRAAMVEMERHIEVPRSIPQIASATGASVRQLERLFLQHMGASPVRYYIGMRTERAREMLLYTDQPVLDVAVAAGFSSTSHFSHWFKKFYGLRPSELRVQEASLHLPS
jgi:transcriptional regulator GlxA family with amidase domain